MPSSEHLQVQLLKGLVLGVGPAQEQASASRAPVLQASLTNPKPLLSLGHAQVQLKGLVLGVGSAQEQANASLASMEINNQIQETTQDELAAYVTFAAGASRGATALVLGNLSAAGCCSSAQLPVGSACGGEQGSSE